MPVAMSMPDLGGGNFGKYNVGDLGEQIGRAGIQVAGKIFMVVIKPVCPPTEYSIRQRVRWILAREAKTALRNTNDLDREVGWIFGIGAGRNFDAVSVGVLKVGAE